MNDKSFIENKIWNGKKINKDFEDFIKNKKNNNIEKIFKIFCIFSMNKGFEMVKSNSKTINKVESKNNSNNLSV